MAVMRARGKRAALAGLAREDLADVDAGGQRRAQPPAERGTVAKEIRAANKLAMWIPPRSCARPETRTMMLDQALDPLYPQSPRRRDRKHLAPRRPVW